MVGGVWGPEGVDQSFLNLDDGDIDMAQVVKAATVLEMVVWDPSALRKLPLSVCAVPIETNFSGPGSTMRGCWFMIDLLGRILEQSGSFLRAITFDAHGSHSVIRRVLGGQMQGVNQDDLAKLGFWKDLQWRDLPEHPLPRLPIKVCLHKGEPIYGIPGVCDLSFAL